MRRSCTSGRKSSTKSVLLHGSNLGWVFRLLNHCRQRGHDNLVRRVSMQSRNGWCGRRHGRARLRRSCARRRSRHPGPRSRRSSRSRRSDRDADPHGRSGGSRCSGRERRAGSGLEPQHLRPHRQPRRQRRGVAGHRRDGRRRSDTAGGAAGRRPAKCGRPVGRHADRPLEYVDLREDRQPRLGRRRDADEYGERERRLDEQLAVSGVGAAVSRPHTGADHPDADGDP